MTPAALFPMTPAAFKSKWHRFSGKESAAYQEHFNDLCHLLRLPTPAQADPTGSSSFCFQKYVRKDAELSLFDDATDAAPRPGQRGFADVWMAGHFAWEYKGKGKNLDDAYKQLLRYRGDLQNPPLLVVCDFERYVVRTNFNGTVQETHEFTNAEIDSPHVQRILRALFEEPDSLKPQRTTAQVTERLANEMALVAKSLQGRQSRELTDARTRAEMNFAQKRNLRIARFLNRVVFCFFAEDTDLLPKGLFTQVARTGLDDPAHFAERLESLFKVMSTGGPFGVHKIRPFNGHLFDDSTVFELTADELRTLAAAGEADWQFIEPSIMGTLFERALEPEQRSQLGAHYTSEADIKTLVEPVLMAPLRREWSALKGELAAVYVKGKSTSAQRTKITAFQDRLAAVTVLDPACGSGNFLYVSLQMLLDLEKEVVTFAEPLGLTLAPKVSVQQLRAIEINPYAFELAQVSVQIGYLQWRRDNGFDNDRTPVLQNLTGFQNEDALLVPHFRNKAKTLKEAQSGEHKGDDALKFYTERKWPECDVIVGNPPFLGGSKISDELGRDYQSELGRLYSGRVSGFADLCCYWFEKARQLIADGKCRRAGLLATQAIRGGASREVLKSIKKTGDIFFAESDRDWVLAGANVHVSMVGFDSGLEELRELDRRVVSFINPNLTANANITDAVRLEGQSELWAYGSQQKASFDIGENIALEMLNDPNPNGKSNSDVVRPSFNATQFLRRTKVTWVVDFADEKDESRAARYEKPFEFCRKEIFPKRKGHREPVQRNHWWLHARPSPEYRKFARLAPALLVTPGVSKHRVFALVDSATVPDHALITFARANMLFFGVLQARSHEVWSRAQATQVRERESGLRYTPKVCFETFPFPRPTLDQEEEIAAAAHDLNALRERWLNPPEWTQTRTLTFPGSSGGPWARYLDPATVDPATGIGTVRYPRLEPRDAATAALLKKRTLTNLYNERPAWLDLAHRKLDAAVAAAYGWPTELSDDAILERLLALNLARAAEERTLSPKLGSKTSRPKADDELL